MASPYNITRIPAPRVPFIDERTGLISREWYRFLLNLFILTGSGTNPTSLDELQLGPPPLTIDEVNVIIANGSGDLAPQYQDMSGLYADLYSQAQLASMPSLQLGTMAPINIDNVPYIGFDTTPENLPTSVGTVAWDGGTTLGVQMTANVLGAVNESGYYYIKASSAITKGQVVMFTGAVGASGVPTGAPATGITDGTYIMGVAAEGIATNGFGLIQTFGTLRNVNTSGYSDGDILWYNPSVAGGLTSTKPVAPNVKVQMAAVINGGSSGGGTILIRIDPGSTLGGSDSNAQITSPSNGQILTYDEVSAYWKNVNIGSGTGITVSVTTAGGVTVTNTDTGSAQNIFKNVAVAGQSTIVADSNNDTLSVAAGTGVTLATNATTDTLTITTVGIWGS